MVTSVVAEHTVHIEALQRLLRISPRRSSRSAAFLHDLHEWYAASEHARALRSEGFQLCCRNFTLCRSHGWCEAGNIPKEHFVARKAFGPFSSNSLFLFPCSSVVCGHLVATKFKSYAWGNLHELRVCILTAWGCGLCSCRC